MTAEYTCVWLGVTRPTFPKGCFLKQKFKGFEVGCMKQVLGPGALGRPRGIGWRGWWEGGSGWGTHVTPWLIHVNV